MHPNQLLAGSSLVGAVLVLAAIAITYLRGRGQPERAAAQRAKRRSRERTRLSRRWTTLPNNRRNPASCQTGLERTT